MFNGHKFEIWVHFPAIINIIFCFIAKKSLSLYRSGWKQIVTSNLNTFDEFRSFSSTSNELKLEVWSSLGHIHTSMVIAVSQNSSLCQRTRARARIVFGSCSDVILVIAVSRNWSPRSQSWRWTETFSSPSEKSARRHVRPLVHLAMFSNRATCRGKLRSCSSPWSFGRRLSILGSGTLGPSTQVQKAWA